MGSYMFKIVFVFSTLLTVAVSVNMCSPMIRCTENTVGVGGAQTQSCSAYIWDGNKVNHKAEFEDGIDLGQEGCKTTSKYNKEYEFCVQYPGNDQVTVATFERKGGGNKLRLTDSCETWTNFYGFGEALVTACMLSNREC